MTYVNIDIVPFMTEVITVVLYLIFMHRKVKGIKEVRNASLTQILSVNNLRIKNIKNQKH